MKKPYCTQNNGHCPTCSLVNYGRDCQNNPIPRGRNGGRKPIMANSQVINIRVGADHLAWLDAKGNRSEAIRALIDAAMIKK